ncbi:MAG: isochorismatase family cysteine hydrolase [Acutalibacteraceae bacterium]|nr:isochorismatase family cysteine hydrolase [Acutalibacteraceae bacterium]
MNKLSDNELNFITGLKNTMLGLSVVSSYVLQPEETCIIVVDMTNGFVKEGALASKDIEKINDDIADFVTMSRAKKIDVYALADSHNEKSTEFATYPIHCLENTDESKLTDEIASSGKITVINKNSTNGFLEDEFKEKVSDKYQNYIIVGCCTDICVQQLALTLKAEFNRKNQVKRVIVPQNLVATYDSPNHNAELTNIMALYNMSINGIEIVKKII